MNEHTLQHKKAWEYDAYGFWVRQSGTPAERAEKIAKDKSDIYNSKEWKELRIAKLRSTNGLCEECMKEGIVTSARCVHHVVPIETARTKDEMRRLAIDCGLQGLKSLCFACHARIHKDMGSNTAKIVRQRAEARQDRWADNLMQRFMTPKDDDKPTT